MIVLVDDREMVTDAYESGFAREGVSSIGFEPPEFEDWVESAPAMDLEAVEAFVLGNCQRQTHYPKIIRGRCPAPVLAMNENEGLEQTLRLFEAGADDVIRKPVHVREILARIAAIVSRGNKIEVIPHEVVGALKVYFDGRDPEVNNEILPLPRRERRILEHLAKNVGRRVTKAQLFSSVYGLFDDEVDESVIESHVSKLRKKLRLRLGHDPIDSKRYLGYCLKTS